MYSLNLHTFTVHLSVYRIFNYMNITLLRQLIRETLLKEGVYDPGILKAVFMAGGPGSGKSHTAKLIFGADPNMPMSASTASGLKLVNSDPAFEMLLKKAGISPGDLGSMSDEEFKAVTVGPDSPRGKASRLKGKAQSGYMGGKLGIVLDGTGDDLQKIATKKEKLEAAGYDTFMIFVNTSLEVAQERNSNRERKLPEDLVKDIWSDVQENLGGFQGLFGAENLVIVDNTKYGPIAGGIESAVNKFINRPIRNPIGRKWVEQELAAKGPGASLPRTKTVRGTGSRAKRRVKAMSKS